MDQRINHEIEKVVSTLEINDNNVAVKDSSELKESDFLELTESPYFLQIFDNDGNVIIESRNISLFKPLPFNLTKDENLYFESYDFEKTSFRAGYFPLINSEGQRIATLQLSVYERNFQNVMSELLFFNLWAVAVLLVIVIMASLWASKKTFKPINQIIADANLYNFQDLDKRIDLKAKPNDEIGQLRDTLNGLFNRIEDYVSELTHFSDHVSHQLMNPITAIQTEIEYLLKKDRTSNEYKEALVKLSAQTENMVSIVKTLLLIAKSGRVRNESKTVFNLSKLLKNEISISFKDYSINYSVEDNLYLRGESEKFLMVIQNLIQNAIKYTPHNPVITVESKRLNSNIVISIADNGIGIDDSEKENVFRKFYRTDRAEKLGIKGFGLGLSLVKSIIDEASGNIKILDNKPSGTTFEITLPAINLTD
jgi:signal transduction histidine kinase